MDRTVASKFVREHLDKHGLKDWKVKITTDIKQSFLGLTVYKDKTIIINAHHVDIHPDEECKDTFLHEVAHALTPGHKHDAVWQDKAKELGARPTVCSHLEIPEHVIDAIRSGEMVEMTIEEETYVVKRPKFTITRLQDKCPECGKVAEEIFAIETTLPSGDVVKLITLKCFHIIKKIIPRGTPFEKMVSNDWQDAIKGCKHKFVKHKCIHCNEYCLMDFQVKGAQSAEKGLSIQKGFGIFDDMGLGKTVQALAIVRYHLEYTPTLYAVKSAIKFNWFKQINRWLGPLFMPQIIQTSKDFLIPNLRSYIISYDLLKRFPREKIEKLNIKLVVLDECQQIKNVDSARTQEVRKLVSNPTCKVLALSGTPWKNKGSEFFPVLNIMDPIKFPKYQGFLDRWVDFQWVGDKKKMGGIRNITKFKEYTDALIIRREFNEVIDEFPDINRMKLPVLLDDLSQSSYDDEVSEFVKWYNEAVIGGEEDSLNGLEMLAKMSRMRHITGLAKIPATLGFVEEFVEDTDKKLVIFHHHIDVGNIMYDSLTNTNKNTNPDYYELAQTLVDENIEVMKLDATKSDGERFTIGENFNSCKRAILIGSTIASGEGIDLQTCADCVMHERQWNPQNEDQAAPGRFRRIGQKSSVINISFAEAEGTIDEHFDAIVEQKRKYFHSVMNKSDMPSWDQNEIGKQLAELIVNKHKQKNKGKNKPVVKRELAKY